MTKKNLYLKFSGKIVIVGFGSIGQGVLPLILRHIDIPKNNISVVTADKTGEFVAGAYRLEMPQQGQDGRIRRQDARRTTEFHFPHGDVFPGPGGS